MTIHELNALTALTSTDELPVWDAEASGEPTKKITAQNMAASVKSLASLPNNTEMNAAIAQSTAYTEVGTRNGNVNANSSCIRCGNIVVCNIRYDAVANVAVYTGLPKALKTAWARIRFDATHWGAIEIAAGQTSLNYTNKGDTSIGAKTGQLVYIADNN